jgi:hypothetical protein
MFDDVTALATDITFSGLEPEEPGACEEVVYTFTLTVTDCSDKSATDDVRVTTSCCGTADT